MPLHHTHVRAQIEEIEQRLLMSTTVVMDGSTLRITGDNGRQVVTVFDAHTGQDTGAYVSVDANGNGSFDDPGDLHNVVYPDVAAFDIRLLGGNDSVTFGLGNNYSGAQKYIRVDLGAGNDSFVFSHSLDVSIRDASNIRMDVFGGGGDDQAIFGFSNIIGSTVTANADLGAGRDTMRLSTDGDVRDSNLSVNGILGTGDDTFAADSELDGFDIMGATSVLRLNIAGGNGNDTLQTTAASGGNGTYNQGRYDATLDGGPGNDRISVSLDKFNLNGGTFSIHGIGGNGNDTLGAALTTLPVSSGGTIDVAMEGGRDNDSVVLGVSNGSKAVRYGKRGFLFADGGPGRDAFRSTTTAPVRAVNFEWPKPARRKP